MMVLVCWTNMDERGRNDDPGAELLQDGKDVAAGMDMCESNQEDGSKDTWHHVSLIRSPHHMDTEIAYQWNLSQA